MADQHDTRPESMAACFRDIAGYLDAVDENVGAWALALGGDLTLGNQVQADLLTLAAWMDEHPDVDAQLRAALPALPTEEASDGK